MAAREMEVGSSFSSFEAFEAALNSFCTNENVIYTVTDSKNLASENKKVKKSYKEELKYRYIRYECKHGARNKKKKYRGHGLRPNQRTFDLGCSAMLSASIDRKTDLLVIRQHVKAHNHEVSDVYYNQYPEQRKKIQQELKETIESSLHMGVKVKILQDYIASEHQRFITLKDLHNIRQRMKYAKYSGSDEENLLNELQEMLNADPDSSVCVITEEDGTLQALLFVTGQMKETFQKFPEVLFIDGTYCTNKLRLPLYTFLIEDGNGHGQPVAYCFVADEKKATIQMVLLELKKILDLDSVQVVIVDKDLKEIASIKSCIPDAAVQICKFHVLQALTREIRKNPIEESEKKALLVLCRKLVYAATETSFEGHLARLTRQATTEFMAYYNKNWHSVKEFWASYLTNNTTNLGNTTNNRTESHNEKIKSILTRNMSLPEAIKGLLLLHQSKAIASNHENFNQEMKTPYKLGDSDEVTDQILSKLTPYAASIVLEEIKFARKETEKLCGKESCSCLIKKTSLLPCRHVFANRLVKEETLFRMDDAGKRWHLSHQNNRAPPKYALKRPTSLSLTKTKKQKFPPKSKDEKYREAMGHFRQIADFLSLMGTAEYTAKISTIMELYQMWTRKETAAVLPISTTSSNEINGMPESPIFKKSRLSHTARRRITNAFIAKESEVGNYDQYQEIEKNIHDVELRNSNSKSKEERTANVDNNDEESEHGIERGISSTEASKENEDYRDNSVFKSEEKHGSDSDNVENEQGAEVDMDVNGSPEEQEAVNNCILQSDRKKGKDDVVKESDQSEKKGTDSSGKAEEIDVCINIFPTDSDKNDTRTHKFLDITNLKMPTSPPIRGRSRFKKVKKVAQKKEEKENLYSARSRVLTNRRMKETEICYDDITLRQIEMDEIKDPNQTLQDKHIKVACNLLKKKYPHINSLQDPVLGQKLQFGACGGKLVQILHNNAGHWLTVSNFLPGADEEYVEGDAVFVFDSLYDTVNSWTEMQIASLLNTRSDKITLHIRRYQRQVGGKDCGLLAIAAATSLCMGKDPSRICYNQKAMRQHLFSCIEEKEMKPFPELMRILKGRQISANDTKKILHVPLYCVCKLPDNGEEMMIECSNCHHWCHKSCLSIKRAVFDDMQLSNKWKCRNCK